MSLDRRQARKWIARCHDGDLVLIVDRKDAFTPPASPAVYSRQNSGDSKVDVLVAGGVAVDLSCDYTSPKPGDASPQLHTSNPASITQSIGGVGHNVALAAHMASSRTRVGFCSMVGDDM
jgi:pseudouridine-5'-phosphate glycosidase/pseudouridine kinase